MKYIGIVLLLFGCTHHIHPASNPYKIIAYYSGRGDSIYKYPVEKLTHIIYSFLKLENDTLTFRDSAQEQTVRQLVELKKQYPALKIMVSMGGWGGCSPCSELFSSAEHRNNFAKSVVFLFDQYGIDGLDLDWEYPAIPGYPGHQWNDSDKYNFTELVRAIRNEMGKKYLLSFAAGGFKEYLEKSIEWNEVIPLVDFVNLMTYDLVGGYSTVTGHHTPLRDYRPDQESIYKCVSWLLEKRLYTSKLIIGAAFYARVWAEVDNKDLGLYQSGKFSHALGYKNFATYFDSDTSWKYYWDKKAKAPYEYNPSKKLFATFDDKRSIHEKTKFVREKKLGGIMFWELSNDDEKDGLAAEIAKWLK